MKWVKLWNRKHTMQHDYLGRFIWFVNNPYYRLCNIMIVGVGQHKHDFYAEEKEWNRLMDNLSREVYQTGFLQKMLKRFNSDRKKIKKLTLTLHDPTQLKRLSPSELLKRYQALREGYILYTYFFWIPWSLNEMVVLWFERELQKKFLTDYKDIFTAVTVPLKSILMDKQMSELLQYKIQGNLNRHIDAHVQKYQWLGVYSLLDKPWTKKDFLSQISGIRDPKKYLADKLLEMKTRKSDSQRALSRLRKYPKLLRVAKVLQTFAWLRTERVDVWREVLFLSQPFYRELERRMGLKKNQAPHLSYEEIIVFLKNGEKPTVRELDGKDLLYLKNGKLQIIRNQKKIKAVLKKELGKGVNPNSKVIKGRVACSGKAKGRVRIIMSPADCRKMKKGEVLVSNMTHPDYMVGIQKAKAIITDEGGISCHATIISRELKIPCIIGTKVATQVLKNADMVEVDANKGIVKKL